jgi:hypothetical protein
MLKVKSALLIVLVGLAATTARADLIPISIQNGGFNNGASGTVTVFAGSTLNLVSGTLKNIGLDTIVMNSMAGFGSIGITPAGDPDGLFFVMLDSSPFDPPDTLTSGEGPVDVDLFTFDVAANTPVGDYNGWAYAVLNADGAPVGSGLLNIVVLAQVAQVPEPAPAFLMVVGLCLIVLYQRHLSPASNAPLTSTTKHRLS